MVIFLEIKWDKWQSEVLDYMGNITLRTGRQVGKSEVISEKAVRLACDNDGTVTMIVAASQRQSSLLFEKVVAKLQDRGVLSDKPTMTKAYLINGSKIFCMPTGRTGHFIRGFTVDFFIADEAAFIPEMVWTAITPMLAVSMSERKFGFMILLSTPFGKGGFFYDSFSRKDFRSWHVSAEDCKRIPKDFLHRERRRMSKQQYRQEYLGDFVDEFQQYFSTALIKSCMNFIVWDRDVDGLLGASYYLGQDLARMGGDEIAGVIVELCKNRLRAVKCYTRDRARASETIGETVVIDQKWGFKKIFTDSSGLGGPILDLMQDRLGKRRVVGLENASRRVEVQGEEKKRGVLKEDLYANCLMLMETGRLELINDLDLLRSMKSITYEYGDSGKFLIKGGYAHLTEALVRGVWCVKERGLRPYVR